jgi:DNA-binding CsgD family transcriptional regulator/tetratricopeptide (TPR) repeat protein
MSATATALLERDEELEAIERLLAAAEGGSGGVIVIEGEAGAGKTSLLGAAAEMAAQREMLVLRARGGEYERDFPYGVVRQLFEPVLRDRDRRAGLLSGSAALAGPIFEPGAGVAEGGATEHGLYWLAADLAATAPLLLVIDDAQWADLASLQALSYIGRRLDGSPAAMVVGVRSGEPGFHEELLDELRLEAPERVIDPSPLSAEAAALLLAGETGVESTEPFAQACRDATTGNPFLLAELARALGSAKLDHNEESVECLTKAAAAGVASSIRTRLARLGGPSIEVARAVAVLEPNGAPRLVAQLSGLSPADVAEAGEGLITARLFEDASSLAFVHPLVRDAVLTDISEPRRAAMHARAAHLLHEDGLEVDAVAAHLLLAEPVADVWAVAQLRSAAAAALGRGAADAAVRYLRRALREPPARAERLAVSRELGVALLQANDPEGIEVLRTVRAATVEVELRAAITNELASSLNLRNGNEEAAGLIEDSLSELPDPDGELGLMLRAWLLIQAVWGLERVPEVAIPPQSPSPETLPGRMVLQGMAPLYALGFGSMEQARRAAESAISKPEALFADAMAGFPPQGALVSMALADRGGEVSAIYDFAIEGSRRRGVLPGVGGGHGVRAFAHLIDGDLREAQADSEIAVDVLRRFGLVSPIAFWSAIAMRVLLRRGERVAAERLLDELWAGRERVAGCPGAVLLSTRGELRAAAGRHAEARNDFLAAAERITWLPFANPEAFPWRIGLARCEAALGNDDDAQRIAAEAVGLAREAGGVRGIGITLREQGVVTGGTEGLDLLSEAAEVLGGTRARLQHAEALLEHGAALRRANFRKEAREPLREALELAHRCGAVPLEERARAELAATGARPRKAVFTGVESLTPSELRVARMAAEGMTNREIAQSLTVTAKTVETHLRHVYQKLDVAKRTELSGVLSPG